MTIIDLNIKIKPMKFLEEHIGENRTNFGNG